jgi:hypothetical protein
MLPKILARKKKQRKERESEIQIVAIGCRVVCLCVCLCVSGMDVKNSRVSTCSIRIGFGFWFVVPPVSVGKSPSKTQRYRFYVLLFYVMYDVMIHREQWVVQVVRSNLDRWRRPFFL